MPGGRVRTAAVLGDTMHVSVCRLRVRRIEVFGRSVGNAFLGFASQVQILFRAGELTSQLDSRLDFQIGNMSKYARPSFHYIIFI